MKYIMPDIIESMSTAESLRERLLFHSFVYKNRLSKYRRKQLKKRYLRKVELKALKAGRRPMVFKKLPGYVVFPDGRAYLTLREGWRRLHPKQDESGKLVGFVYSTQGLVGKGVYTRIDASQQSTH